MKRQDVAFHRMQAIQLLEIAGACSDPALRQQLVAMAEDWLEKSDSVPDGLSESE